MAQQGLEGLKELNKALKKLDGKVSSSIARKSIGKAARVMRDEIRARTPVGETGNLRDAIRSKTKKLGRTGFLSIIGPMRVRGRDKVTKKSFTKSDVAWIANILEKGADPHLIPYKGQKLKRGPNRTKVARNQKLKINGNWVTGPVMHPGIPPRPFIRPAWHSTKDRLPGVIGRELWRHINKEQKKR